MHETEVDVPIVLMSDEEAEVTVASRVRPGSVVVVSCKIGGTDPHGFAPDSRERTRDLSLHARMFIDVTGVEQIDTQMADSRLRMARSTKLLGARCIITGVNPAVAQTLTSLNSDLNQLATRRTLAQALMACIEE